MAFCDRILSGLIVIAFVGSVPGSAAASTNLSAPHTIAQRNGKYWLQKPEGERFFSLGVCVVDQGQAQTNFDAANPGYTAWQHYGDSNEWARATLKRLTSWGFTTI